MRVKLSEILTQSKMSEYIDHPEHEKFVTVSGHGLGVKERKISDGKTPVQFNGYRIKEGQLIYSRIGASDGAFGIVPQSLNNAVVSKDFPVFNVNSEKVIIDYLVYYLTSDLFCHIASKESFGATMTRFKEDKLLSCKIVLPSIEEQSKIVSLLNASKHLIALRQQELQKLDELVKARFVEMFVGKDYPVLKWNDVFKTTTGKLDSNAAVENGEYPFFTCSKEILRIDNFAFDQEALLLAGNNAAGKYDVKYYNGKFNAYQRTYVLGLKGNWSYQLFKSQLEDKLVYLQQQSLGGLTKYLTMKILGELEFIIPPMEKQSEFENFVKQLDKSKFV